MRMRAQGRPLITPAKYRLPVSNPEGVARVPGLVAVPNCRAPVALPLDTVRNVAPVPLLRRPVGAPPFVEGFFDFQGEPVAATVPIGCSTSTKKTSASTGAAPGTRRRGARVALHVARIDQVMRVDDTALSRSVTMRRSTRA